ncbi:unnamed protein product [Prunus armeniaca]
MNLTPPDRAPSVPVKGGKNQRTNWSGKRKSYIIGLTRLGGLVTPWLACGGVREFTRMPFIPFSPPNTLEIFKDHGGLYMQIPEVVHAFEWTTLTV